jgi:hypothetical protein
MMFPQFRFEVTIRAFMEIEHEHSREIIEIFPPVGPSENIVIGGGFD